MTGVDAAEPQKSGTWRHEMADNREEDTGCKTGGKVSRLEEEPAPQGGGACTPGHCPSAEQWAVLPGRPNCWVREPRSQKRARESREKSGEGVNPTDLKFHRLMVEFRQICFTFKQERAKSSPPPRARPRIDYVKQTTCLVLLELRAWNP